MTKNISLFQNKFSGENLFFTERSSIWAILHSVGGGSARQEKIYLA